ncbi:MAG: Gfo/Idh/MocA family oxidoreductase [Fimbriimonadaceae bacterium]|nr:Gfo/Idh/MocA family oxidoreductase [Fimbriimonadaceae bacterium]
MSGPRLALIGCGGIMRHHLRQNANLNVVALCDPDPNQLSQTAELVSAPHYADHRAMLDEVRPDAVFIASPHADHCQQVVDSFAARANVLLEKPIAISITEAEQMIAARDASGLKAGLAYQRHGQGPFRWLRSQVQADTFGELQAITCHLAQSWKQFTMGTWRQKLSVAGGGMLHDSGSHMVDVTLWATGRRPVRISALVDNRDTEVDIQGYVTAVLDNGAVLQVSVIGDANVWHERHAYWFERGVVFIEDEVVRVVYRDGTKATFENWPEAESPVVNFLAALRGEAEVYAPLECGLFVQQITEGAYRSSEQNGAAVLFAP